MRNAARGARVASVLAAAGFAIPIVLACLLFALPVQAQESRTSGPRPLSLSPIAYGQIDLRWYPGWPIELGTSRLNLERVEIRRLRVGLEGRWRVLSFEVSVDPMDRDDAVPTSLKDAWLQIRVTDALRVRIGQFKIPVGREFLRSARDLDFLERSALSSSLAADRDGGVMFSGRLGGRAVYQIGAFRGDGRGKSHHPDRTLAGRFVWEPARSLDVGWSFSVGQLAASNGDEANGVDGRSPSGYRYFKRLHVGGVRTRLGADAAWQRGPWRLTIESLLLRDTRHGQVGWLGELPSVQGTGVSVAGVRALGRSTGPGRRWDVAWRYEYLGFDDTGAPTGFDSVSSRAFDVRPRSMHAMTAGLSWRPMRHLRVLGNGGIEFYPGASTAPQSGRVGPYYTVATRLQLELPQVRWTRR